MPRRLEYLSKLTGITATTRYLAQGKGKRTGCVAVGGRGIHDLAKHGVMQLTGWQIEYLVVAFEEEKRKVKLSLRQADILDALAKDEALCRQGGCVPGLQLVAK